MRRSNAALRVRALLGLLLAPCVGCREQSVPEKHGVDVGASCVLASDCEAPYVCVFQRCHEECITSRDCDGKLRCVGADEVAHVCQLEQEAKCSSDRDCPDGLGCGPDARCRDVCSRDRDCIDEQVCVGDVCADDSELTTEGALPSLLPVSCRAQLDCQSGWLCVAGVCQPACRVDRDCENGQICEEGVCSSPIGDPCACRQDIDCRQGEHCVDCACEPLPPPECLADDDCAGGYLCVTGTCECGCVENRDCGAAQTCDGCVCVPAEGVTTVLDATIKNAFDVERMRGITEVAGTLRLFGNELQSTAGLAELQRVGRLELDSLSLPLGMSDAELLAGLSNLTVLGDVVLTGGNFTTLTLPPGFHIGGNLRIEKTSMSCPAIAAIQAQRPTLTLVALFNGGCGGACQAGQCIFVP